jgi:hypothetical protein
MPLLSRAKSTFHLAVVAAFGITTSAMMFCVVKHLERSRAEAHFQQVAEQRLSMVRTNVAGALDTILAAEGPGMGKSPAVTAVTEARCQPCEHSSRVAEVENNRTQPCR